MPVVRFVRIDENHIERALFFGREGRQRFQSRPDANLDHIREPGPVDIFPSDLGMVRISLECNQTSSWFQTSSQPDRAVSAERTDFQNATCASKLHEQLQQLSLVR